MVPSLKIHLKSHRTKLLEKTFFIIQYLFKNISLSGKNNKLKFHLRRKDKKDFTVIRSPHVHKKSREQFALVTYHWIFSIQGDPILPLLNLLKSCSFYGVQVKIYFKSPTYFFENNKDV
uniref:ribosomal protein S10 n=1 Tax=Tetraselmis marina TaxID=41888 RepID=UPI0021823A43|nr:ribosomal protein S10 [Tetraselmis marina]UVF37896.1 ribosomal protein S10 [Tetraselmis marina]